MSKPSTNKTKFLLSQMIENKRKEMLDAADISGMTNEKTLRHSRELDELILKYQKEAYKES